MIVSELISHLQKMPQDRIVVARGYESGYNEITDLETENVIRDSQHAWYDGEYQIADEDNEVTVMVPAIILE